MSNREWNSEQGMGERLLREGISNELRDAARYRWLEKNARQKTAYDLFGNGGMWSVSAFSHDQSMTFGQVIDSELNKEGRSNG